MSAYLLYSTVLVCVPNAQLAVPNSVDDALLRSVAQYRSRGRVPVLSVTIPLYSLNCYLYV